MSAARDKILRRVLFEKATSKKHLKDWILNYLDIDIPDGIVCGGDLAGHEGSNSSPMDLIWEVYQKAIQGNDEKFQKVLVYAARDSYKTVSASILELLCLFHLNRNVAHMAAIEAQASKCQDYLSKYIEKPILRDYVTSKNKRTIEITRYVNSSGKIVSPKVWEAMPVQEREDYNPHSNYMKILVATLSGANCVHPDTLINMWAGPNVPAALIKTGDILRTFDYHSLEFIPVAVGATSTTRKQSREFIFNDGTNLVVSDDHKVFTDKGWRCASKVKLGDKFTEFPDAPFMVTSFENELKTVARANVRQVILGTLLGDASLTSQNNKGVRYAVNHCSAQYLYLQYIQDVFRANGISSKVMPDGSGHKLFTPVLPIFDEWFTKLYRPNKQVTLDILNELTWEGVAYWFMDDVRGNPVRVGSGKDHCFELATCGFTQGENEIIAKWFNDKGFGCRVSTVTNQSKKIYPIIIFTLEASRKLSEVLSPYFVPVMRYKLLPPLGHDETITLDTGEKKMECGQAGFVWSDKNFTNSPKMRKWRKDLRSKLQATVVQINLIGEQRLVDIHIATDNPHHQSFLANSWKLIHNSEHVPFMCVEGETQILVESPNSKRDRVARTARGIFKRLAGRSAGGRSGGEKEESIEVVDSKVKFLSYNFNTGRFEFKPATQAHCRKADVFKVTCDDGKTIECTDTHPLYVFGRGFVQVKDLLVGDDIISVNKAKSNGAGRGECVFESSYQQSNCSNNYDEWDQVVLGSLLGDGGVYIRDNGNPWFREQHCLEQSDYMNWKRSIINNKVRTIDVTGVSGYTGAPQAGFQSGHSPAFIPYVKFKQTLSGIDRLDALGLAVWYMDDGCAGNGLRFSSESFTKEQNEILVKLLNDKFGIEVDVKECFKNDKIYYYLLGGVEAKRKMVEICKPFIHHSMAYKFDLEGNRTSCRFCGQDIWFYEAGNAAKTCGKAICQQLKTGTLKRSRFIYVTFVGSKWVYDFTIDDNHNFIANGLLNKNCLDELDLAPAKPVEEARMIPCLGPNGELPITFMISSRKFKFGLVQKELNKASDPKSNIQVRHWNLLDVSQACQPIKHLPNEPKIPIFVDESKMESISKEDYDILSNEEKNHYRESEGYAGCLKNCSLFAGCLGRLATKQLGNSKLLKPVTLITETFKSVEPDTAQAQLMCWKPSSIGSIYPHFARSRHMKTADDMVEMIEGTRPHHKTSKPELIQVLQKRGWTFHLGMDFGFTHNFSAVLGATDGYRLFIIDVMSVSGLELNEKVDACKSKYLYLNPLVYPDPAYPSDIKTFKKNGFRCKKFEKFVLLGIDAVRSKLMPGMNQVPEMFLLAGDTGCELLAKRIEEYHWALDAAGEPTEEPDKEKDDECDALRYLCQNLFGKFGKMVVSTTERAKKVIDPYSRETWMNTKIQELTSDTHTGPIRGKKGSFIFDF